jgi:hypothetical protein
MHSNERALRALRAQVQFELAESAAEFARIVALSMRAEEEASAAAQRRDVAADHVRTVMRRAQVNPPLLAAMRRLYHVEQRTTHECHKRLKAAREREQEACNALAHLRNRERSLERALEAERRSQQLASATREILEGDDLWLQHMWRASS